MRRGKLSMEIEAETKILAEVAVDASRGDSAPAAHELGSLAVGEAASATDVECPVLIVFYFGLRPGPISSGVAS